MAYTEDKKKTVFDYINKEISEGRSLRSVLREDDMPSSQTFYKWLEENEDKSKQYNKSIKSTAYINNIKCKANPKGSKASGVNDYRKINASKVNRKKFPNSNIYIVKIEGHDLYKIGVSQNTDRRFKDLSSATPFNLITEINSSIKNAYDLEIILHNIFKHKHVKNEWFNLTRCELDACIYKINEWI